MSDEGISLLPWQLDEDEGDWGVFDDRGHEIAYSSEANARLIVEAVNAYDALRAVAEAARPISEAVMTSGKLWTVNASDMAALRLALAELDKVKA